MSKIPALILLLTVYGGLGGLGFALLWIGAYKAARRGAVIAVALVSAVLISVQTLLLYFLSDISRGWGGNSFAPIPALVAMSGVVSILWFLRAKLKSSLDLAETAAPRREGDLQRPRP